MAEFEEKLQSILGNPELMGQIMSMAGAMNQQQQSPPPPPPQPQAGLPILRRHSLIMAYILPWPEHSL